MAMIVPDLLPQQVLVLRIPARWLVPKFD